MNLDYWFEQIKLTTASAASLAVPVLPARAPVQGPRFLPLVTGEKQR